MVLLRVYQGRYLNGLFFRNTLIQIQHANSATATAEQKNSSFEFLQIFFSYLNQLSFQEVLKWWWKKNRRFLGAKAKT